MPKPLLVGELNPYGADPRHALYPLPANSAGGRLCRLVLGYSAHRDYLRDFDRSNLCSLNWSSVTAKQAAGEIIDAGTDGEKRTLVLLGAKVTDAFASAAATRGFGRGFPLDPFRVFRPVASGFRGELTFATLPHPSGRCRAWNEPGAFTRARETLREAGVVWNR